MNKKRWLGVLILATWLSGSGVMAQSSIQPIYGPPSPLDKDAAPPPVGQVTAPIGAELSPWIRYQRDCCDGKPSKWTPLYTEAYLSVGPTVPLGQETLSRNLLTGWSIMGGARAMFFNEPMTSAWVVDLHMINTNEGGRDTHTQFPITFFQNGTRSDLIVFQGAAGRKTFSVHDINRESVGLGFGRDWYLWQPANTEGIAWRWGAQVGGRYGSERANFNEFGHTVDVVGTAFLSAHSDIEFPCGRFYVNFGMRLEWSYTWSDVLQQTSDSQDISLFLTAGIRW
jgi:hypothetical protein